MDLAAAYRDGRERLSALVATLDGGAAGRIVPLTPAWRVRDVVAHVTGVAEDLLAGGYPDFSDPLARPEQAVARDAWAQAQVDRRRDRPVAEVVEEWNALGPRLDAALAGDDPAYPLASRSGATFDLGCHLHDVRHALGAPGDRDAPVTRAAFAIARGWLALRAGSAGLPPLRVRTPEREWVLGDGAPAATVAGDAFELFRALSGRRARSQLLDLGWDGDPVPYVAVLSPYPLPERPVSE